MGWISTQAEFQLRLNFNSSWISFQAAFQLRLNFSSGWISTLAEFQLKLNFSSFRISVQVDFRLMNFYGAPFRPNTCYEIVDKCFNQRCSFNRIFWYTVVLVYCSLDGVWWGNLHCPAKFWANQWVLLSSGCMLICVLWVGWNLMEQFPLFC